MFRAVRRPLAARKSLASLSRAHKHDVNVKERHARARCERQSARRCGSHEKKQRPQNPRAPPHTKRDMAPRASRFTSAARSPVKILFPRLFFCEPNRKCLRTGLFSEINAIQLVVAFVTKSVPYQNQSETRNTACACYVQPAEAARAGR